LPQINIERKDKLQLDKSFIYSPNRCTSELS